MDFNPGFRFSVVDALVLLLGAIATVIVWSFLWYAGFIVAFVLVHFFLFCNVFRVSRLPELVWGGVFSGLATTTILTARPGWLITAVVSLVVTVAVVFRETRKPSYHGILWNTVNPNLRTWWESSEARDG